MLEPFRLHNSRSTSILKGFPQLLVTAYLDQAKLKQWSEQKENNNKTQTTNNKKHQTQVAVLQSVINPRMLYTSCGKMTFLVFPGECFLKAMLKSSNTCKQILLAAYIFGFSYSFISANIFCFCAPKD